MNTFGWFGVGLLVGVTFGVLLAGLLAGARRGDDLAELREREATIHRLRRDPFFRGGDAA